MSINEGRLLDILWRVTYSAVKSSLRHIQALEDYGYELDEEWDKLLRAVEQTKPVQKKEEAKKTSYIKQYAKRAHGIECAICRLMKKKEKEVES